MFLDGDDVGACEGGAGRRERPVAGPTRTRFPSAHALATRRAAPLPTSYRITPHRLAIGHPTLQYPAAHYPLHTPRIPHPAHRP
jgi:hypothetical protein